MPSESFLEAGAADVALVVVACELGGVQNAARAPAPATSMSNASMTPQAPPGCACEVCAWCASTRLRARVLWVRATSALQCGQSRRGLSVAFRGAVARMPGVRPHLRQASTLLLSDVHKQVIVVSSY